MPRDVSTNSGPKPAVDNISVHIPFARLGELASRARERNLNVELYLTASDLDRIDADGLGDTLQLLDYGPSVRFHAPFIDLIPGAIDPRIRAVTLERFAQTIKVARALRPDVIVFHSGYEKWKYSLKTDVWLEASVKTWNMVLAETGDIGTDIAIENIVEDHPRNLHELMAAIDHPRFGLCFDTGHFHIFSTIPLDEWLDMTISRIVHLHVHDNDRQSDRHAPPGSFGTGGFDFERLFRRLAAAGRKPSITLEAHSEKDAVAGMEYLSALFKRIV
ncbi:MAG: sugar phosphate isomerase/epimerase [Nitrospirae bacterium]|nr:sugar phosphate isomerase/epimerase [Nitrospirota bacterium]